MLERIDLRRIREEKGISLDKVYEDLKIPKRVLQAIESGDLSDLFISPVYVKGFAKSYARYLGVSPDKIVAQLFGEEKSEAKSSSKKDEKDLIDAKKLEGSSSKRSFDMLTVWHKILDFFVDILAFIVAVFVRFFMGLSPKRVIVGGIILLAVLGLLWIKDIKGPSKRHISNVSVDKGKDVLSQKKDLTTKGADKKNTYSSGKEKVSKRMPKESFSIIVEVSDNCWMRVKADGVEVYRGILNTGDVERWTAKQSISLWVGNAGVVSVKCGDKVYQSLGRRGQVIREIVFSPDCSYRKLR